MCIRDRGNTKGTSVLEVIEAVKQVTGREFKVENCPRRAGDPPILVGSCEKAMTILGWEPKYADIQSIITHAWKWYQKLAEQM